MRGTRWPLTIRVGLAVLRNERPMISVDLTQSRETAESEKQLALPRSYRFARRGD